MSDYPVLPGAEAYFAAGSDVGCLLVHGYTGSPHSMRYLAEYLAEQGGLTVSVPRLPGHGTAPEEMAGTTADEWLGAARAALQDLNLRCSRVFVVGLSMGGTLALHLAATQQQDVHGVVPINAPLFLDSPQFAAAAFNPELPELLPAPGSDIKRQGVAELSYQAAPRATAKELFALVATTRELAPVIQCPLLAFYSRDDHVVPPANGPYLLDRVASTDKALVMLEDSYHVATMDNDRELIAKRTLEFVRAHTETPVAG